MSEPFTAVPVIDIATFLHGGAAAKRAVARQVAEACETIGFLYIAGHGFDPALIERAQAAKSTKSVDHCASRPNTCL